MIGSLRLRGTVSRASTPVAHHSQGPHLRAHGGNRGRADHFAARGLGGVRNWDYRYCWLRDATFTLYSLMAAGYRDEARAWRDWLLRAMASDPAQLLIMYGPGG